MNELLLAIGSFLVTLGLLVTVHEFGHFWVARRLGVKVLRFSVGFGKPLWLHRMGPDQTEYAIGIFPLGGYVNMLDETEAPVDPGEAHRAFNRQGVGRRMAIVVAGPVANLLFAIAAYWLMFMVGIIGARPLLGVVEPGTPAARAGFTAGEEIVAVEGRAAPTWEAVTIALLQESMDQEVIRLETVDPLEKPHVRSLNLDGMMLGEPGTALYHLGLRPGRPPLAPVLDVVERGGAAFKAGLESGDRIRSADDHTIEYWEPWVEYVRTHPGQAIRVEAERAGNHRMLTLVPTAQSVSGGGVVGRIGASVRIPESYGERLRAELRYPPGEALGAAVTKVWEMSVLTLRLLGKMVEGEASVENISGPLSIAQLAGKSAAIGFAPFLAFLGLVSLSLGILNLLPIPVLDGGHLLYYFIELVTGAPIPERVLVWGQKLGTAILFGLMTLAVFNDFNRLFGS
ncbi:intramembrane zinc metalloprotease RseP [Gammaproteobacteria bacterium]